MNPYSLFPEKNPKMMWFGPITPVMLNLEKLKFSQRIKVWGAISASILSELCPKKARVTANTENILAENLLTIFI